MLVNELRLSAARDRHWHKSYSEVDLKDDYMRELTTFDVKNWEAPKRAARLSAAVKRYKTSNMIGFILGVGFKEDLDLTPIAVKRLNKGLFGRTGSQGLIVYVFGEDGRIRRSKDAEPDRVAAIVSLYQNQALKNWKRCLEDIAKVKGEYKKAIAKSNEDQDES